MSSTSRRKVQLHSKPKTIEKSNNCPISREHLKLVKKCLCNQHQQNSGCDDDVDDLVVKKIKKRIKRNKFTLVNMGVETTVVCTLKNEAGDSEEVRELGKSGNNDKLVTNLWTFLDLRVTLCIVILRS